MCQLAYASNLKKVNSKLKLKLFNELQKTITSNNRSGYGIASKNTDGYISILKTLDVTTSVLEKQNTPIFCSPKTEYSEIDLESSTEVIFHARTSTNSVSLQNTHPFVKNDTVLCHNGVLQYYGENYEKLTDNDTEDLTHYFDKYHMSDISENFSGYAAFISFKNEKTYIVRDSVANLHYGYSEKLDCHFFATYESTLKTIQKILKIKMITFEVKSNSEVCISNNQIEYFKTWNGLNRSKYADSLSSLSLGRSISSPTLFSESSHDLGYYDSRSNDKDIEMVFDGQPITLSEYEKLDNTSKNEVQIRKLG